MSKVALVTGATGQLSSYLCELLINSGYKVFGMVRRSSTVNTSRIDHLLDRMELIPGDMTDESSLMTCLEKSQPDVVFNLAAQSFVHVSWNQPELTMNVNALGVIRLLEAIRKVNPKIKIVQMSSSEQFGLVQEVPQTEKTKFYPRSIYGVSKVAAHYSMINYRESYGMFCSNAICFNYESPRRGTEFISRKITDGIRRIITGVSKDLKLGNILAQRDWSHASDVAHAVLMISEHSFPDDFIICSGEKHSVTEFLELSFNYVGLNYKDYIKIDPNLIRPAEVDLLLGDYSKIKNILGWQPKINFHDLVEDMLKNELEGIKNK